MGLVDYNSDSDSDSGSGTESSPVPAPAAPKPTTKKPFQKLASSGGKILVSLPSAATTLADAPADQGPPAKRARLGTGAGRFSNFSSFLPPPTKTGKPSALGGGAKSTPRPGIHLKTSAEAAFNRDTGGGGGAAGDVGATGGSGLGLPPPKAPSVPEGQKAAEDVELVGRATMFRPLSVGRKPVKKKVAKVLVKAASPLSASPAPAAVVEERVPKRTKVSLFSIGTDEAEVPEADLQDVEETADYKPMLATANSYNDVTGPYDPNATYTEPPQPLTAQSARDNPTSLSSIADDLNLSASARRELFGRGGRAEGKVVNFNMDREYAHNTALRALGEAVQHNPVRAIQPGKHSLKQIINTVQNQESALEENFAKNRATQREAGSRYGWR